MRVNCCGTCVAIYQMCYLVTYLSRHTQIQLGMRVTWTTTRFKVIPQKQKLPMNFFETFPEYSLPSTTSKNTIQMIGHHSRLRDVMGQSYLICPCPRTNHVRYSSVHVTFCGSSNKKLDR